MINLEEQDMTNEQGFNNKRRNFIAISLFIILYRSIGLQIKHIIIFGNEASVERVGMFSGFLFVFFFYYAWRYSSAPTLEEGLGNFKSTFRARLYEKLKARFIKGAKKVRPSVDDGQLKAMQAIGYWSFVNWKSVLIPQKISNDFVNGIISTNNPNNNRPFVVTIYPWSFWWDGLSCLSKLMYKSHIFSEYVFPYILGVLAILELFHWSVVLPVGLHLVPFIEIIIQKILLF